MVKPFSRRYVVILGAKGMGAIIPLADIFIHYGFQRVIGLVDDPEKYDKEDRDWLELQKLELNKLQDPNELKNTIQRLGVGKDNKDFGYICVYDPLIISYLRSRELLGLNNNSVNWKVPCKALLNARIKPRARELWNRAGLQTSWTILSQDKTKNIEWHELGNFEPDEDQMYFVKPISGAQSSNIHRVKGWTKAKQAAEKIRHNLKQQKTSNAYDPISIKDEHKGEERIYSQYCDILVEEELVGEEYTIDGFIQNRNVCFVVQHKELLYKAPFHGDGLVLSPPDNTETEASKQILAGKVLDEDLIVSNPCRSSRKEFRELIEKALQAIGLDNWVFHAEVVDTSSGLRMIELNPRVPGGLLAQTAGLHLGINLLEYLVRMYLGIPSLTSGRFDSITGHLPFYADKIGVVQDIEGVEMTREIPEVDQVTKVVAPGDEIVDRNIENYAGFVTICADSHEKVRDIAKQAIRSLNIVYKKPER